MSSRGPYIELHKAVKGLVEVIWGLCRALLRAIEGYVGPFCRLFRAMAGPSRPCKIYNTSPKIYSISLPELITSPGRLNQIIKWSFQRRDESEIHEHRSYSLTLQARLSIPVRWSLTRDSLCCFVWNHFLTSTNAKSLTQRRNLRRTMCLMMLIPSYK